MADEIYNITRGITVKLYDKYDDSKVSVMKFEETHTKEQHSKISIEQLDALTSKYKSQDEMVEHLIKLGLCNIPKERVIIKYVNSQSIVHDDLIFGDERVYKAARNMLYLKRHKIKTRGQKYSLVLSDNPITFPSFVHELYNELFNYCKKHDGLRLKDFLFDENEKEEKTIESLSDKFDYCIIHSNDRNSEIQKEVRLREIQVKTRLSNYLAFRKSSYKLYQLKKAEYIKKQQTILDKKRFDLLSDNSKYAYCSIEDPYVRQIFLNENGDEKRTLDMLTEEQIKNLSDVDKVILMVYQLGYLEDIEEINQKK